MLLNPGFVDRMTSRKAFRHSRRNNEICLTLFLLNETSHDSRNTNCTFSTLNPTLRTYLDVKRLEFEQIHKHRTPDVSTSSCRPIMAPHLDIWYTPVFRTAPTFDLNPSSPTSLTWRGRPLMLDIDSQTATHHRFRSKQNTYRVFSEPPPYSELMASTQMPIRGNNAYSGEHVDSLSKQSS
jgi:hypothetical protein